MVSKTLLDGKTVQVTFRMPPLEGVSELHLCGDFNGWNTTAVPLARQADGSWTATLVLEPGKSYRYRFCDGEGRWHNDWQADAYMPNELRQRGLCGRRGCPESGAAGRAGAKGGLGQARGQEALDGEAGSEEARDEKACCEEAGQRRRQRSLAKKPETKEPAARGRARK